MDLPGAVETVLKGEQFVSSPVNRIDPPRTDQGHLAFQHARVANTPKTLEIDVPDLDRYIGASELS